MHFFIHSFTKQIFSYILSATVASMPLFGVSSYAKTSTCLPLYMSNTLDKVIGLIMLSARSNLFYLSANIVRIVNITCLCASHSIEFYNRLPKAICTDEYTKTYIKF